MQSLCCLPFFDFISFIFEGSKLKQSELLDSELPQFEPAAQSPPAPSAQGRYSFCIVFLVNSELCSSKFSAKLFESSSFAALLSR